MISQFLSNRWNVLGLQFICYWILGYILSTAFPFNTLIIIFVVLLMIQMLTYVRGVNEGIKYIATHPTHLYADKMTKEYKKLLTKYNKIKKSKGRTE